MSSIHYITVDPEAKVAAIHNIQTTHFNWSFIKEFIGCELLQPVQVQQCLVTFVDEEGLLKPEPRFHWTSNFCYPEPLTGKSIICHAHIIDSDYQFRDFSAETLEDLRDSVQFPSIRFKEFQTFHSMTDHPIFGKMQHIIRKAVFEPIS